MENKPDRIDWKRVCRELEAENAKLKADLLAQQVCIEQMQEALAVVLQCRPIGYETMTEARERKIREALALPSPRSPRCVSMMRK